MKIVAQSPRDGRISVADAPAPLLRPGFLLIANHFSLLSSGTERRKMELAKKNLVQKARARPDLARKVLDRARAEGFRPALAAARDRLDTQTVLGYSAAGTVQEVGARVEGFKPGDRVACGGGGYANHAEVVAVPQNLVARVADDVPLDHATYATVGAIALHGVRQAEAHLGECVGVIGLGLVGQLAVRLLGAAGCRAVGIDLDPVAVDLATSGGALGFVRDADGLEASVEDATRGTGLDAVVVCAAGTSNDPLELGARLARDRGRLIVVGDVPVDLDRGLMYEKELELRLSRSYGPGRYDRDYEERGHDLPAGYVRWTEQRNMQAFVDLLRDDRLDLEGLTTHRFPVERAAEAYEALSGSGDRRPFGILLEYSRAEPRVKPDRQLRTHTRARADRVRVGAIGAGNFARGTLLPAFRAAGAELAAVTTAGGMSAADVAQRFGFERAAESADELLDDDSIDAIAIATRHSEHAQLVAEALRARKSVFVEKPLALNEEELADVESAVVESESILMVGFNRRFAPLIQRLADALPPGAERVVHARVNAGPLPADHWLNDPRDGGGRLIGEGCHFVDLLCHLVALHPRVAHAVAVAQPRRAYECSEHFAATLLFDTGAVASLVYTGGGDPRLPKERIEAFGGGVSCVLDDFRRLELYHGGRREIIKAKQDKGHRAEVACFVAAVAGRGEAPDSQTYLASMHVTLALAESLRRGTAVELAG